MPAECLKSFRNDRHVATRSHATTRADVHSVVIWIRSVGTSWESSMFFVPFIYVPLIGAADRFLGCKRIVGCNRIIDFDLARGVLFTHSQCVLARASASN